MGDALRPLGPANVPEFFNAWLKGDPMYEKLFVSGVNHAPLIAPFADKKVPTIASIIWAGRIRVVSDQQTRSIVDYARVGSWGDLLGPQILQTRICNEVQARDIFLESANRLIVEPALMAQTTTTTITQIYALLSKVRTRDGRPPVVAARVVRPIVVQPEDAEPVPVAPAAPAFNLETALRHDNFDLTAEELAAVGANVLVFNNFIEALIGVRMMARNATGYYSTGGVTAIVHVICAVARRGSVSDRFCDKITAALSEELNIQQLILSVPQMQLFYRHFGDRITAENVEVVMDSWTQLIPAAALRLRLTVDQAAGSGLTAMQIIGRAMNMYRDFDWQRVADILVPEMDNFNAAVQAVGDNKWYGFNKDLGVAKSTRFKNLTWVAKELLMKIGGEASLGQYAGWTRRAKNQATLDAMIAAYEANLVQRAMAEGDVAPLQVRQLSPTINSIYRVIEGNNIYV